MADYFDAPDIPQYSISLFSDSASQGAKVGAAVPGLAQQIVSGVREGISEAQKVEMNELVIEKTKAQVAQENTQAYQAQLEQEVMQANEETIMASKTAELEAQRITAINNRDDLVNEQAINKIITSPSPENAMAILQNDSFQNTFFRKPDYALQVLSALEAQGGNKDVIQAARNTFDAVRLSKQQEEQREYERKLEAQNNVKNREEMSEATSALSALPGFTNTKQAQGDKFDYSKVNIYPIGSVATNPDGTLKMNNGQVQVLPARPGADTGYLMTYGDQVIEGYLSPEDGKQYQRHLQTYKIGKVTSGAPRPSPPVTDQLPANAAQATPTAVPQPAGVNQDIVEAARIKNQEAFAKAQSQGQGKSYQGLITQGRNIVQRNTPVPNFISTPQSTPTPAGTPQITVAPPADSPQPVSPLGTKEYATEKVSQIMGGAPVTLNLTQYGQQVDDAVMTRINSVAALKDRPALLKGVAAVESSGRVDAKAPDGGAGLFQFMIPAASDVGLTPDERFNPDVAAPAAMRYLEAQYDGIQKTLNQTFNSQGLNITPDPRMVLAAYNGGMGWIQNGIRAGNTTWDQMKDYLLRNKTKIVVGGKNPKTAGQVNIEYPEKVILASIPFLAGGNASDDDYIKTLMQFGIVQVDI